MSIGFEQVRARIRELPLRKAAYLAVENRRLRHALGSSWAGRQVVGESQAAHDLRQAIRTASVVDGAVLVTGEPGAGKRLVAHLVHQEGPRGERPLLSVGCLELTEDLAEAELFGFERGALPHARTRRLGRLELADGGTLLLDELSGLAIDLQRRLSGYLRRGTFRRLGARRGMRVSTRLVATTTRDPLGDPDRHHFARELVAHLRMTIHVPPLRARREDIAELATFLLATRSPVSAPVPRLADDALEALLDYDWPGNVRELEQALERAHAVCEDGLIRRRDLPRVLRRGPIPRLASGLLPAFAPLREVHRLALAHTLAACAGNGAEAARRLGLSKKGIYIKMKRLGLQSGH